MACGCLGGASTLAVVPLAVLMGLPASSPATLGGPARDSSGFPGNALLGLGSPGDGLAGPRTCYQYSAQSEQLEAGKNTQPS